MNDGDRPFAYLVRRGVAIKLDSDLNWQSENESLAKLVSIMVPTNTVSDAVGSPHLHLIKRLQSLIGGEIIYASSPEMAR